jgi:hypothetical protein
MEDKDFIKNFVTKRDLGDGRQSCLMIALQNARVLCGRNKECNTFSVDILTKLDGVIEFEPFIGLVNYLLIIDMMGVIFNQNDENKVGKRIKYVLKKFGNMNEAEQNAISSLRNCLAHNYGLACKDVKFILTNSTIGEIVKLPQKTWDGNYSTKDDDETSTIIYTQNLINRIEAIYEEVKKQILGGTLKSNLSEEELKTRFTIINEQI